MLGTASFLLAIIGYGFPEFMLGRHVYLVGIIILVVAMLVWRGVYAWLIGQPYLQERVYVLGSGERAARLVEAIRTRKDLGMDVVGWAGALGQGAPGRDDLADGLRSLGGRTAVDRIIVAVDDRRNTLPLRELMNLRLQAVKIEDASSLLEKISGKIDVQSLHPSALIYSEGFRLGSGFMAVRRVISFLVATLALVVCLPLIPLIAIAVTVTSPGPVLFRQRRVGRRSEVFTLYKFRTMRQDAESHTGAVWAEKNDPRVTGVGRFLRRARLDEIPQLWNVVVGDMGFVGPRPERPEFVQLLSEKIPYYNLRHVIRPGLTGWAQVCYQYGASVEDAEQKLQFDLYYVKHVSLMLDLLIIFRTLKTVLLGRGAQ